MSSSAPAKVGNAIGQAARHVSIVAVLLLAACFQQPSAKAQNQEISAQASLPAIALSGRVTDAANILNEVQEASLTAKLARLENETQHQMVVVTVPSLGGKDIETFTTELVNQWGIGRADYDDGVVVLVAPNERKVRIAVGYGLEKTLTNEICADIIEKAMIPDFADGAMFPGIDKGVDALIAALH